MHGIKGAKVKFGLFAILLAFPLVISDEMLWAVDLPPTLSNDLISYIPLDEGAGSTVSDSTGANVGVLVNFGEDPSPSWVDGTQEGALSFDGVDDYVSLTGNSLDLTNSFTVSLWVRPGDVTGTGAFLSIHSFYRASGFRFFIDRDTLVLQGQTTAGWESTTLAEGMFSNNSWYHLVIAYDNRMIRAYVNGVSVGSADWGGSFVMNPSSLSRIGTEGSYYFNGAVDEVMFFDSPLDEASIQALYEAAFPSEPHSLTATAASSNQINLTWEHSGTNVSRFVIQRGPSVTGPWVNITNVSASVRSFSNTGLSPSTAYSYKLVALLYSGTNVFYSAGSNEASATTLSLTAPSVPSSPTNLTATAASSSQINLSWQHAGTNVTRFVIQRGPSVTGPWVNITNVSASVRSFSNTGLSPSTAYSYRLVTLLYSGTNALYSAGSNEASATTMGGVPAAPGNLTASILSPSRIQLGWRDNSNNEAGFIVERSLSASGPWSRVATVGANVTSYADSGLAPATTYNYRITAYN